MSKGKTKRVWFFFAIVMTLGISRNLTFFWSASQVEVTDVDDAPIQSTTTSVGKKKQHRVNTTISAFPRWNDPQGIQWQAIEEYIRYAGQNLMSGKDLLECPRGGCPIDMPNVLYIFGARFHPSIMNSTNTTIPSVWVEGRRRKLVGTGFARRYPILEELMDRSLHYLWTNSETATLRYPYLVRNLFPHGIDHFQTQNTPNHTLLGIPLIMNFGDNRQCHYQNLGKKEENRHHGRNETNAYNVPVFTLAVPTNCQYAFPIPHPAVLDTAKVYGHQWDVILERRRLLYPLWNQTHQIVWRGSPTGGLMRRTLVYRANTVPTNLNGTNVTADTWFDVGFGKPYHKIDRKYLGPRIRGRSRIWFEDFSYYSVVLDADGSSWSERFGCLLCLNTVVAKLDPAFVDYLWPTVQADQHFVSISKDSTDLWSVLIPLLHNQQKRAATISMAHKWCTSYMTYESMIHFFLRSLEYYVMWLDRGDPNWLVKWHRLLLHDMPPKHHHWQALPLQQPKAYFPLWREDVVEETDANLLEEEM